MERKRQVAILLFLCPLAALGQWTLGSRSFGGGGAPPGPSYGPQDIFTPFTTGSGNLTTSNLGAGTVPASVCTWSFNGSAAASTLTVGASQGALAGSVGPVSGVTYPSSTTTQSIAINDANGQLTAICDYTGGGSTDATWSGYITMGPKIAATSQLLFDRVVMTNNGGFYAALQLEDGQQCLADGGYGIDVETNPGFTTTHSPCIPVAVGTRYWANLQFKGSTTTATVCLYNPANYALVGCTSGATGTGVALNEFRLGQNEGGTSATTSYIEDSMLNFSTAPAVVVPGSITTAPRYVGQGVASSATTSGTTIAVTRTPASTANGFAVFACTTATTGTIAITDSQGNTYTQNTAPVNINGFRCAINTRFGFASTASDTITATFGTSSTGRLLHVVEFANGASVDGNTGYVSHASTTGGAVSSSSVTPAVQPELGIAFFSGANGNIAGNGWAPLSFETTAFSVVDAAQINATTAVSANGIDFTAASGVNTTTALITIR